MKTLEPGFFQETKKQLRLISSVVKKDSVSSELLAFEITNTFFQDSIIVFRNFLCLCQENERIMALLVCMSLGVKKKEKRNEKFLVKLTGVIGH